MKRSVVLLVVLFLAGITPSFSQALKKGAPAPGRKSLRTERTQSRENDQETNTTTYETNTSFMFSIDLGRAYMQIPAFTDLNFTPQDAYKIRSHDFMNQFAFEEKLAKSPIHGPVVFGIKGKVGLAYSYWPTQQGQGEPGNFFASNGSYFNAGTYLHSGDAINIKGLRWALSPDLTAHYSLSPNIEVGAAVGPCFYGYAFMTIKDPWTGYSTSISNTETVWHSKFLTNHLKSFSVTVDWSANVMVKAPGSLHKLFFEIGMTGNSFIYGIGIVHPITKKI